ncbi:MAG: PLP-dependent aminotransferase family protein [Ilumatobacteraceae bacterium]
MNRSINALRDRTTFAVEVPVSLSGVQRGRRGAHLANELRNAIVTGRLTAGTRLPSSRDLAGDLAVSRGVVVTVYEQLVGEGHLSTGPGRGTRVCGRSSPAARASPDAAPFRRASSNPGQPDPALFPRRDWLRAYGAAMRALPDGDLSYGDPKGLLRLRVELAAYLARVRNVRTDPDQVIVVNGFAQGLVCVVRHLVTRHGTPRIAVEDPGSVGTAVQLQSWGATVIPIAVDGEGIDTDALEISRADAVVVTPAHQYPTGVTLAASRRLALVDWADRHDALIVEDDYDAEYRYDRAALTSLHALAPHRTVVAGSTSKSLAPALRLGWLVAPGHLADEFTAIKEKIDLATATIEQAALAHFIADGSLDRHLRRTRVLYRQRRDILLDEIGSVLGPMRVSGIAAGLHVLIDLAATDSDEVPDERVLGEDELAERARACGLDAQPLKRYRHVPGPPGLLLGYGMSTPAQLREAIRRLGEHLRYPSESAR